MMDFVRSLAPVRNDTAGRAVALLRSRIVQPSPISSSVTGASDLEPTESGIEETGPPSEATHRSTSSARRPLEEQPRQGPDTLHPRAQVVRAAGAAPEAQPSLRSAPSAVSRPQFVASMPPRIEAVESTPIRHVGADVLASAASTSPRDRRGALASTALPQHDRHASIAPPARAQASPSRTQAPMTATALAARTTPAAAAPTVIHVSIDRIDLRLPASAPARTPQRTRAGGVALADYLGARKSGGSGAPR